MCKADKFMTSIVNPEIIVFTIKHVLSAPIVRLNRKSWLTVNPLISTDLIIIDSNLDVFSRNTSFHNCRDKRINSKTSIEDVIHDQYFLPLFKVFRRPCPTININLICVLYKFTITTSYYSSVEYWFSV